MLIVGNCIVSDDIADNRFCCDLQDCRGRCCVEGDAGAPLAREEVEVLESLLPKIMPYMTKKGREAVQEQGVYELFCSEEPCTTLVEGKECAFVIWEDGKALCSIEKAFRDGKISFRKPISCHLYPIRVADYGEFSTVNYHRWEVCKQGKGTCSAKEELPLYMYLQEPLIRRFGQQWYDELVKEIKIRNGK
ncbi:MAG: DUF3109 family protein [Bacteroidales bacterium]|nr:DUF3109 family protein [Bacteroidales bacterium]